MNEGDEKGKIKFDFFGKSKTTTTPKSTMTSIVPKEKQTKLGMHKAFTFIGEDNKEQIAFINFGLNYSPVLLSLASVFLDIPFAQSCRISRGELIKMLEEKIKFA